MDVRIIVVCVFASVADAVIIRDEADRNSGKKSAGFVASPGVTGHNVTSGGHGIGQSQDILYRHGGTALASSDPDGQSILGLQLASSAPGIGINMAPALPGPVPLVALLSPYQTPMSGAQGLTLLAASTAETEGDTTGTSGHAVPTAGSDLDHSSSGANTWHMPGTSGSGVRHEPTSLLHNSDAERLSQLEQETDSSGARQAFSIMPAYAKQNLGQIYSFRLGFPKYGYSLISGVSDLKDGSSLGSGTSSLGHRPNTNVGNALPNADIHLASGYTEESAALDYENSNIIYGQSNLLASDNSGIKHSYVSDNSNIFTGQPHKFSILAGHFDSAHNSNIKQGLNIENGSSFGTDKTNSNMGYNSGTGLEQAFSTASVESFGSGLGHDSNVFGQDQSLNFDTGSDASDLGHTKNTKSGSGRTEIGHQSEVSSAKHPNLDSAPASFSTSNHDLGNLGQRKISGSVRDLSNGAGLYFTALEKDSTPNSAFSLSTSHHGSERPNQEHSLDSSARTALHFAMRGTHTHSGSSSIPSVVRHGPKFRGGSGSSNLGHPSSRPPYSGTGSTRPGQAVSASSLQGQTSVVGARHYRPKHAQSNGASYPGHTSQREGLGLRYRPVSSTEVGKENPGFKQTSRPGTGFGINSLSNIENIDTGSRGSGLETYGQGFRAGSFIQGKGLGSSSLGSLISGSQSGLGSQISKAGSTATSTSNFNLGNYAVSDLGLARQSFHQDIQHGSVQ